MLEVSPQVMTAFEARQGRMFVEKAIAHLSRIDPGGFGALDMASRRNFVADTIEVAEQYGVAGEEGTILLLEARCTLGPAFPSGEEHEWARNLLSTRWADETRTMEYVRDTATTKARERAAAGPSIRTSHA